MGELGDEQELERSAALDLVEEEHIAPEVLEEEETPALTPLALPYISEADDELDKLLESTLAELGSDALKGHVLSRTGGGKYKLGERRIFMKLTDGAVGVREGSKYTPVQTWAQQLEPAEGGGDDNLFGAIDAASPYAQHE